MTKEEKKELIFHINRYIQAEGCGCCSDSVRRYKALLHIANLLSTAVVVGDNNAAYLYS